MDADMFVKQIDACTPSLEALMQAGLTSSRAEGVRAVQNFRLTSTQKASHDPVLDLIGRYEMATVEIGLMTFCPIAIPLAAGWFVGEIEAEPIYLSRQDGSLFTEEYGEPGHILWDCARDSGSFLDAMLKVACFLTRCATEDLYNDQVTRHAIASECTVATGGELYRNFYEMLLG